MVRFWKAPWSICDQLTTSLWELYAGKGNQSWKPCVISWARTETTEVAFSEMEQSHSSYLPFWGYTELYLIIWIESRAFHWVELIDRFILLQWSYHHLIAFNLHKMDVIIAAFACFCIPFPHGRYGILWYVLKNRSWWRDKTWVNSKWSVLVISTLVSWKISCSFLQLSMILTYMPTMNHISLFI
jgi:hypothetical protein